MKKSVLMVLLVTFFTEMPLGADALIVTHRPYTYAIRYEPDKTGEELSVWKSEKFVNSQGVGRQYVNSGRTLQNSSIFFDSNANEIVWIEWNKKDNKLFIHGKNFLLNDEGQFFNDYERSIQIDVTLDLPLTKDDFNNKFDQYELSNSLLEQVFAKLPKE